MSTLDDFISAIETTTLFRPDGNPDPAWSLSVAPTWVEAHDRARGEKLRSAGEPGLLAYRAFDVAKAMGREDAWRRAWRAAETATAGPTAYYPGNDFCGDAAMYACVLACGTDAFDPAYVAYVERHWRVWAKGYGNSGERGGVIYAYAVEQ